MILIKMVTQDKNPNNSNFANARRVTFPKTIPKAVLNSLKKLDADDEHVCETLFPLLIDDSSVV